jgi:hypothetical protein
MASGIQEHIINGKQTHNWGDHDIAALINNLHDRETNAIRAFHKQRIMFVFYNEEMHRKYHAEQSHIEWFLQYGFFAKRQD